jgi:hypothetical protein
LKGDRLQESARCPHLLNKPMSPSESLVEIKSRDYWFKIVEFLQQNWTLTERNTDWEGCMVFFAQLQYGKRGDG